MDYINFILNAESKALATYDGVNINCVPVSTIDYVDNKIWLFDYFMNRTSKNISKNEIFSLACWSGMKGVQIKGKALYYDEGVLFDEATLRSKIKHPDRVLKGVIILEILKSYSVSPGDSSLDLLV